MTDYTPTDETVESLGEDIQAYLVMDGVYLDHEITRSVARCILSDPDWAGVVTEEPEWEYGVRLHPRGRVDSGTNTALYVPPTTPHITMERAVEMAQLNPRYQPTFHCRRKAGPWVPVKQGGADDA
jgi:hypothetical protein